MWQEPSGRLPGGSGIELSREVGEDWMKRHQQTSPATAPSGDPGPEAHGPEAASRPLPSRVLHAGPQAPHGGGT